MVSTMSKNHKDNRYAERTMEEEDFRFKLPSAALMRDFNRNFVHRHTVQIPHVRSESPHELPFSRLDTDVMEFVKSR